MANTVALSAHLKSMMVAALISLTLTAAAAAFALGFNNGLTHSLADPNSAPRLRGAALERLDESLGYRGFLRAYADFLLTGDRSEAAQLRQFADEAEASLAAFSRAAVTGADRDYAASLSRLEAPFRRAAMAGSDSERNPSLASAEQLDADYATLRGAIAAAGDSVTFDRIDGLSSALRWAEIVSIGALATLSGLLLGLAWVLREQMISPLRRLRRSIAAAAAGAEAEIWGSEHPDEIGAVARAAERLRLHRFKRPSSGVPELQLTVMERLAKGAARLETDISKAVAANERSRARIEKASLNAVDAGRNALEAARIAQKSALRLVEKSAAAPPAADRDIAEPLRRARREPENADAVPMLETLARGIDGLERFVRNRRWITEEQLVPLNAALFTAMNRLSAVAGEVSDPERRSIRAAE